MKGHQLSFLIICFPVSYKQIIGFLGSVSRSFVLSATMPRCSYGLNFYFLGDTKGPAQEINSGALRSQLQKVSWSPSCTKDQPTGLPQHEAGTGLRAGRHPHLLLYQQWVLWRGGRWGLWRGGRWVLWSGGSGFCVGLGGEFCGEVGGGLFGWVGSEFCGAVGCFQSTHCSTGRSPSAWALELVNSGTKRLTH